MKDLAFLNFKRTAWAWPLCFSEGVAGLVTLLAVWLCAQQTIALELELPHNSWFTHFKGVDHIPPEDAVLSLKNNKVDVQPIVQIFNYVKETHYEDDLHKMEDIINQIRQKALPKLCEKAVSKKRCINQSARDMQNAWDNILLEKEDDILYPRHWEPLEKDDEHTLKVAQKVEDIECMENIISSGDIGPALLKSSPETYQQMLNTIKTRYDSRRIKYILNRMVKTLNETRWPKDCWTKEYDTKAHPVCDTLKEEFNIKEARFLEVAQLVYGPSLHSTTEGKTLCFACEETLIHKENTEWQDLLVSLEDQSQCVDPKPGEQKQVFFEDKSRGYYSWTVKKEQDGSYSIPFKLKFSPAREYDGDVPKKDVPSYYMKKAKECVQQANTKMLGPNGEKLKLVIEDSTKTQQTCLEPAGIFDIKIGSKNMRSNVKKYEADVTCPTIVHEILHLAGLCDEYTEQIKGFYVDPKTKQILGETENHDPFGDNDSRYAGADFKPAYDCRVTGDGNIMANDSKDTWESAFNEGEPKSLITKGQLSLLLYGSCDSKNRFYNECARLAYKSSLKDGPGCLKTKIRCITLNGLKGKDKVEEIKK